MREKGRKADAEKCADRVGDISVSGVSSGRLLINNLGIDAVAKLHMGPLWLTVTKLVAKSGRTENIYIDVHRE